MQEKMNVLKDTFEKLKKENPIINKNTIVFCSDINNIKIFKENKNFNDEPFLGEVIAKNFKDNIPTQLSQLTDDSTHRLVTDEEKEKWNIKKYDRYEDIPNNTLGFYKNDLQIGGKNNERYISQTWSKNDLLYEFFEPELLYDREYSLRTIFKNFVTDMFTYTYNEDEEESDSKALSQNGAYEMYQDLIEQIKKQSETLTELIKQNNNIDIITINLKELPQKQDDIIKKGTIVILMGEENKVEVFAGVVIGNGKDTLSTLTNYTNGYLIPSFNQIISMMNNYRDQIVQEINLKRKSTNDYTNEDKAEVAKIKDKIDITALGSTQITRASGASKWSDSEKRELSHFLQDFHERTKELKENKADKSVIDELKKSVADGKKLVASAISEKGFATSERDSFSDMANRIKSLTTIANRKLSLNRLEFKKYKDFHVVGTQVSKNTIGIIPNRLDYLDVVLARGGSAISFNSESMSPSKTLADEMQFWTSNRENVYIMSKSKKLYCYHKGELQWEEDFLSELNNEIVGIHAISIQKDLPVYSYKTMIFLLEKNTLTMYDTDNRTIVKKIPLSMFFGQDVDAINLKAIKQILHFPKEEGDYSIVMYIRVHDITTNIFLFNGTDIKEIPLRLVGKQFEANDNTICGCTRKGLIFYQIETQDRIEYVDKDEGLKWDNSSLQIYEHNNMFYINTGFSIFKFDNKGNKIWELKKEKITKNTTSNKIDSIAVDYNNFLYASIDGVIYKMNNKDEISNAILLF